MKVLIAVVSCNNTGYRERRQAQRDTWVPDIKGMDIRFFVGAGEAEAPDVVTLDCGDDYRHLPEKCRLAFKWALAHGYDYVFKTDDDCYIRPERLLAAIPQPGQHYVGRYRLGDKRFRYPYCSGFGYWLSKHAMEVRVHSQLKVPHTAEDLVCGQQLASAGIIGTSDNRYIVHRSGHAALNGREGPRAGNDTICSCEYEPAIMAIVHQEFLTLPSRGGTIKLPMNTPFDRIDILVKTFLRDGLLERTVKGIEENLPGARMIIVDDGHFTKEKVGLYATLQGRGHIIIQCPFDSGYGYKSNRAREHYNREFVLRASDDWVFDHDAAAGVKLMIEAMDANQYIGIASGRLNNMPYECQIEEKQRPDGLLDLVATRIDMEAEGLREKSFVYCDLTVNYSLVRTELMVSMVWDEQFKIGGDHWDLYKHCQNSRLNTVWVRGANINSQKEMPGDVFPSYANYRRRARLALPETFRRHGWNSFTDWDGRVDTRESVQEWADQHAHYADPEAKAPPRAQLPQAPMTADAEEGRIMGGVRFLSADERFDYFSRRMAKRRAAEEAAKPKPVYHPKAAPAQPPAKMPTSPRGRFVPTGNGKAALEAPTRDIGGELHRVSNGQYCIMPGYRERKSVPHFDDTGLKDEFQRSVYERAREQFDKHELSTVLDLGCGSGWKLLEFFGENPTAGVEVEPTLSFLKKTWPDRLWFANEEAASYYDLVICSDVIEHVQNPDTILFEILRYRPKVVVMSTPDREQLPGADPLGPPKNRHHVREWNQREFLQYLQQYFAITSSEVVPGPDATHIVICTPKVEVVEKPEGSPLAPIPSEPLS